MEPDGGRRKWVASRNKLSFTTSGSVVKKGSSLGKISKMNGNDGSTDYRPEHLDVAWERTFYSELYFVKGFDREIEIAEDSIMFLLFNEGTFYKNPIPVSYPGPEEGKALILEYFATGDTKDREDDWGDGPRPGGWN